MELSICKSFCVEIVLRHTISWMEIVHLVEADVTVHESQSFLSILIQTLGVSFATLALCMCPTKIEIGYSHTH